MLETLKLAYRHQLDTLIPSTEDTRLTPAQKRELGRRLARYWQMESHSSAALDAVLDQVAAAAQSAWQSVKDEIKRK